MSKCSIFLLRNLDINTVSRALDYGDYVDLFHDSAELMQASFCSHCSIGSG